MKYTISEFAELLGVTVDTIRLYEKYGIVKPIKSKKNNYRYFDDLDARNMLMSRWYRSLEFSMQEVSSLTRKSTTDAIIHKINERKVNLTKEIERKLMILKKLEEITDNFSDLESIENKCVAKELPGIYRIRQTDKNNLVKSEDLIKKVEEWMKYLPFAFFSFHINSMEVLSTDDTFDYNWGLALEEKDAALLGIKADEGIEYIEGKKYISSIIKTTGDYITRESMQFMIDYIHENQLKMDGDIIGRIILTEKTQDVRQTFLEVNIPVDSI
ncbi:MerR family transcriptional regulator [Anaerocolumna sp. AGMB13025]|uniref:MerR family transcriptional regulator n=1 Tax=Anaerocolumna sp. AGMB13025 TaxID=3039116 RepID=UPI00241CD8D8|nr:MerR family transcriptional regulator [Anaerocolumna sp. AGMB13025]WFR59883.1 MerR family transcriptional regulator [Anaerocolumna sp. AGMB13025]